MIYYIYYVVYLYHNKICFLSSHYLSPQLIQQNEIQVKHIHFRLKIFPISWTLYNYLQFRYNTSPSRPSSSTKTQSLLSKRCKQNVEFEAIFLLLPLYNKSIEHYSTLSPWHSKNSSLDRFVCLKNQQLKLR